MWSVGGRGTTKAKQEVEWEAGGEAQTMHTLVVGGYESPCLLLGLSIWFSLSMRFGRQTVGSSVR
jgi:hypothetical protein